MKYKIDQSDCKHLKNEIWGKYFWDNNGQLCTRTSNQIDNPLHGQLYNMGNHLFMYKLLEGGRLREHLYSLNSS